MKQAGILVFTTLILVFNYALSQTIIGIQNFDGGTPTLTYTSTGGNLYTGNSAGGDVPASSNFYTSATTAYGQSNGTGVFTSGNVTGLASYTSKYFEFRLASWSIGSTTNGADGTDNVRVAVSLDGGTTFSDEILVSGASAANATWHYSTGTGLGTVTYDGNNVPLSIAPAGSGARTTDGYSTIHVDLPNGCTSAILKITLLNNSNSERWTIDDIKLIGTLITPCVPLTPPTVQSNTFIATPQCTTAQLNWASGNGTNRIVVLSTSSFGSTPTNGTNYTANTVYGSGAQIGAGNYVVYNGTSNAVTVSGLSSGTTYYVHIFEYNYTTSNCDEGYYSSGNTEFSFTTNTSCTPATPQIRAILADACGSNEGRDELIIVENGTSPLSISDITITFPTAGLPTYCNSGCSVNTLGNNASYVNSLNTQAGCTLFYYADPIPANAMIVIFTGNPPTFTFDYSSLCPSSLQYYVIFCNNSADLTGRFGNSGAAPRTLTMTFGATNEAVTYIPDNLTGNGSFVNYDDPGNPTYNSNIGCIYPLGNPFSFFNASNTADKIYLTWDIIKSSTIKSFQVERLNEQGQYEILYQLDANKNLKTSHFSYTDERPIAGINTYRIGAIDNKLEITYSDLRIIERDKNSWSAFAQDNFILFTQTLMPGEQIQLISPQGQVIQSWDISEKTNALPIIGTTGIYLISKTNKQGIRETKTILLQF